MKFIFKIISWFLTIVVVAAVVGGIYLYENIYDRTTVEFSYSEDLKINDITSSLLVDAFDETGEKDKPGYGKLNFKITPEDINQLLFILSNKIQTTSKGYIQKIYMANEGTEYTFFAEVNIKNGFVSRVALKTELEDKGDYFTFTVKGISAGDLDATKFVKWLVEKVVKDSLDLNKVIADTGFHFTFDKKTYTLTYNKDDFVNDIMTFMNFDTTREENNLMGQVFNFLFDKESHEPFLSFAFNEGIDLGVSLKELSYNESYLSEVSINANSAHLNVKEDVYDKLKVLVANKTLDAANDEDIVDHARNVFDFLFKGYNKIDGDQRDYIDTITSFSSIGISDRTEYKGIITDVKSNDGLTNAMLTNMSTDNVVKGEISKLYESDINDYLKGQQFLGYSFFFTSNRDNNFKAAYVTVNDFYVDIYKGNVSFVIGFDVSGYQTYTIVTTTPKASEGAKLSFELSNIYFGNIPAEKLKEIFLSMMQNAMGNSNNLISVKDGVITFDFSSFVTQAQAKIDSMHLGSYVNLTNTDKIHVSANGANIDDNGYLAITYDVPKQ